MRALLLLLFGLTACNCAGAGGYHVPITRADHMELLQCEAARETKTGEEVLLCIYANPSTACYEITRQGEGEQRVVARGCADRKSDYAPGGPKFRIDEWA